MERPQYKFPPWIEKLLPVNSVISYLYTRGLSQDAEDICSTITTRLENAKNKGKNIANKYAWVALRNLAIDACRKISTERKREEKARQKATVADPPLGPGTSVADRLIDAESDECVQKLVADAIDQLGLGLRQRVIIKLRNHPLHKFTFKEIGRVVGYSESTVRVEYKKTHKSIEKFVYDRLNTENGQSH